MAKKTEKQIIGPDGASYPESIIDRQIVKTDRLVRKQIAQAEKLSALVKAFNESISSEVVDHLEQTAEDHHQSWKGNTVLKTFDGTMQIEVDIQMQTSYDERLQVAAEIIRKWLDSKLAELTEPAARKLILQVSQIAKTALRIDHKGNVDRAKLIQLKKFEFANEPEWLEAMQLIDQSERITGSKRYIRFKKANPETGKLEAITVDFSRF